LHEVRRRSDERPAQSAVEPELAAADRVDDDAGAVRRVPDLELELSVEGHVTEGRALHADVAPLAVEEPRHVVRWADVDVLLGHRVVEHARDRVRLADLLGLEALALESKKISKTNAVTSMLDYPMPEENVHVGPSDYVPWLLDRKWCYIRMEGTTFGDVPLNAELKLEVWDSPNSAGVVIDAIRCCKLGLDRGLTGTLVAPSAYFMKSPPQQIHDDIAFNRVEAFIRGDDNETLVGTE